MNDTSTSNQPTPDEWKDAAAQTALNAALAGDKATANTALDFLEQLGKKDRKKKDGN